MIANWSWIIFSRKRFVQSNSFLLTDKQVVYMLLLVLIIKDILFVRAFGLFFYLIDINFYTSIGVLS